MQAKGRRRHRNAPRFAAWAASALVHFAGGPTLAQTAQGTAASTPPALQSSAAPAATDRPVLSLDDAVTRALQVAPDVVAARGDLRVAEAQRRSAFGAYLPSASVNAGTGLAGSRAGSGSDAVISAGASINWDVFTGFQRSAERTRADAQKGFATAQNAEIERATILEVTRAYFEALRAESLTSVSRARIERAEVGLAAAERRAGVGSATRSDVLRANLELNSARNAQLQADASLNAAELELGRLVGVPGGVHAAPPTAEARDGWAAPLPANFLEEVVEASPRVAAALAQVTASGAGIVSARSQYLPRAALSAGYDWNAPALAPTDGTPGWSVRLGLSYTLFDGFLRDEAMERARVQQSNAQAVLDETRRRVRSSVERALDQVRLTRERLALAAQAVEVAREDLRVQQERYNLGVATMLDLLTSQENLATAETDLVAAEFDRQVARAELEALVGRRE